jgi:hypothetical protein
MLEFGIDGKGSRQVPLTRYKHGNKPCLVFEHLRDFSKTLPVKLLLNFQVSSQHEQRRGIINGKHMERVRLFE